VDGLLLCGIGAKPTCRSGLILKSWLEILKTSGIEAMAWASLPVAFGENFLNQKDRILPSIVKSIVNRNNKQFLIASDDPFVSEEEAKQLADLCGGQDKRIIGAGHSIPAEVPELFAKNLLESL